MQIFGIGKIKDDGLRPKLLNVKTRSCYILCHPADFFADRSVKALQEVYIFQP